MDLPGRDQVAAYLRHLTHGNRRPRTLYSRFGTLVLFLGLIRDNGQGIEAITRSDVEAFIEREQDRGIKITTIRTRLVNVQAFLRYLVEEGIVSGELFNRRRIRLQLPERLPRAMDPDDLHKLLSVIRDIRDRALILVLLRTGLRIGELLQTKMADVHLKERKIEIYEGEKNRLGRVVYLSDDAVIALRKWLKKRNSWRGVPVLSEEHRDFVLQHCPNHLSAIYIQGGIREQGIFPAYPASHLCHGVAQCRPASGVPSGLAGTPEHRGDPALCPADR